ncbi:hypothetical protein FRC17_003454 [Serendipita sp. 399]|nr:hypothetical protein FRC17_003454 [Serendipita sp. 399]
MAWASQDNKVAWLIPDLAVLQAPCLSKLEALKLDVETRSEYPTGQDEYHIILQKQRVKPPKTIVTLAHEDARHTRLNDSIAPWIATNAAIKNLIFMSDNMAGMADGDKLTNILTARGTRLELLYAYAADNWLATQDPTPYRNLVSLGSILLPITTSEYVILQITDKLSYLKRLRTIELSYDLSAEQYPPNWKNELFAGLEMQFPLLTRVYLIDRSLPIPTLAFLYKKSEDGWSGRPARVLTYWQIALGEGYD